MGSVALNRTLQIYLQAQSRYATVRWLRGGCSSSANTVRCILSDSATPQIKKSQVPASLASLRKKKPTEEPCDGSGQEQLETVCDNASEKRFSKTVNLDESSSSKEKEISTSTLKDAEKVAIELLAGRAFSVAELGKKLRRKKFPLQVVEKVVADIKARGLVNDGLYAESFSRSRWLSATWGPRRIKQALVQKGVSEAEVNKATRKVFEDDDDYANHNNNQDNVHPHEIESGNTRLMMSEASMDRLFIQASKQWLRGQDLSEENRKARVVRWLQYRGFNWATVTVILRRLQSQFTNDNDNDNGGGSGNKKMEEDVSEESIDKLLKEVSKQWIKGRDAPIENRKARITRWLRYRGYNWEVIGVILKKLQSL